MSKGRGSRYKAALLSAGGANGVMDCGIAVVCLLASVLWNIVAADRSDTKMQDIWMGRTMESLRDIDRVMQREIKKVVHRCSLRT